jgi:hypothetical protein
MVQRTTGNATITLRLSVRPNHAIIKTGIIGQGIVIPTNVNLRTTPSKHMKVFDICSHSQSRTGQFIPSNPLYSRQLIDIFKHGTARHSTAECRLHPWTGPKYQFSKHTMDVTLTILDIIHHPVFLFKTQLYWFVRTSQETRYVSATSPTG